MYGQSGGYGGGGGVDIDEFRRRRAMRDERMAPLPVMQRPEPPEEEPQQESAGAQAIRQFSQMAAGRIASQGEDGDSPAGRMPSQTRQPVPQSPGPASLPGEARVPSSPGPVALPGQARVPPPVGPAMGQAIQPEPPRMTRMPAQDASAMARPPVSPPTPTRPDPRAIAQQEAAARTSNTDPIAEAQRQAGASSKRGFWDIMKTAGVGALQGFASGGGLGGALGGALAGGAMGAISPRVGGEYRFDVLQRPRMEQDMNRRMQQEQFRRQQEQASLAGQKTAAEIEELRARTEAMPGREAGQRGLEAARTEYYKSQANKPAAEPPLSRIVVPGKNGPEQKFVRPQEGVAYPAYERPRVERSGGGGGGARAAAEPKEPRLTPQAIEAYNEAMELKQQAEDAFAAIAQGPPASTGPFRRSSGITPQQLQAEADAALRKYNAKISQIGQLFPEIFETGAGVDEGGRPSPWSYVKRRQ